MFQKQEATKRNEEMSEQKEHSVILQSFLLNLFCSDLQEGGERMKGGEAKKINIHSMMQTRTVQHSGKGLREPGTFRVSHEASSDLVFLEYKNQRHS